MKKIVLIVLSIIITLSAVTLSSCKQDPFLSKDEFLLTVGEFFDVGEYVSGECNVSVVDSSVVSLMSGTVLKGLKEGRTDIVVTQGLNVATASVTVSYSKTDLVVSCSGSPFTVIKGSIMEFNARILDGADSSMQIVWTSNGSTVGVGKSYQFTASEYGVYNISATADGCTKSISAVCFDGFSSLPIIQADKTQISGGESVSLSAQPNCNYYSVEWFSGDEKVGSGVNFDFLPSKAGVYTVYALVNGVKTNEITITAVGKAEIANLRVDVDSYPNVYLRWDGSDSTYQVVVGQNSYNTSENYFDITNMVDLATPSVFSVKCLANEYLTESDELEAISPVLTSEQISYLIAEYLDGNYYLTSDQEVYDLIGYALIFRPNSVRSGEAEVVTLKAYMGYDSDYTTAMLLAKGWSFAEQTGSYSLKATGSAKRDNVVTMEITFYTEGEPDDIDTSYKTAYNSLLTPSFDSGFLLENTTDGAVVETSDELYYAVQKGYDVNPIVDSDAERIYQKAKQTIGNVLSNEMSNEQKVRAIYEWVMWQTSYDYEAVTVSNVAYAVKQPAYYLEGVFDYGFAVCDGIAKAVSLLCNMVDIPCVRVVGVTDNGLVSRHAWNKVLLDGNWYIIDATWGDSLITIEGQTYEGALHAYYLKADCEMPTHRESYSSLYPKANHIYDWYNEQGDENATMYVRNSSIEELSNAIEYGAQNAKYTFSIYGEQVERDFFVIEICLSKKAKAYFKSNTMFINAAITEVVFAQSVPWAIVGDYLLIMLYS